MVRNHFKNIKVISKFLDSQISVFGINIGFDPILGLVPGIGDFLSLVFGLYVIHSSNKLGVNKKIISQMWANLFFDFLLGLVPGIGDIMDIFFRANKRNVNLLENYLIQNRVEEGEVVG